MISFECDAVVFDLDGVLVDSGAAVVAAWHQLSEEFGLDLESIGPLHGVRTVDALPSGMTSEAARAAEQRLEVLEIQMSAAAKPVRGALPLLRALPLERWGVATSGSHALATARLTAAGVPHPRVMITAEDVTAGKPDPAPYLAAARALALPPSQLLVFEDAPSGAAAAHAAGSTVIAVATTHAAGSFPAAAWVDDLERISVPQEDPLVLNVTFG